MEGRVFYMEFPSLDVDRATELHDPEAIELFITQEVPRRALEDCRDEPPWRGRLGVTEVELDHEHTSLN